MLTLRSIALNEEDNAPMTYVLTYMSGVNGHRQPVTVGVLVGREYDLSNPEHFRVLDQAGRMLVASAQAHTEGVMH